MTAAREARRRDSNSTEVAAGRDGHPVACRHDASRPPLLGVKALKLLFARLARARVVDLRGAPLRARIVRWLAGGRRDLLPVMQLLLPASLIDIELARRLPARPRRIALLLQHAQLQFVLLLLALQLVALQVPQRGIAA